MSKWTDTLFDSLETARAFALQMSLEPTEIVEFDGKRSFYVGSGKQMVLLAQKVGGGPVRELKLRDARLRRKAIQHIYYRGARPARLGKWKPADYSTPEELVEAVGLPNATVLVYQCGDNETHFKTSEDGRVLVRELSLSYTS